MPERERERAERPLNRAESMRAHKGIQPVGKLVMSGGQIEVLIRGRSYSFLNKDQRGQRLGMIILLSFITALCHYREGVIGSPC